METCSLGFYFLAYLLELIVLVLHFISPDTESIYASRLPFFWSIISFGVVLYVYNVFTIFYFLNMARNYISTLSVMYPIPKTRLKIAIYFVAIWMMITLARFQLLRPIAFAYIFVSGDYDFKYGHIFTIPDRILTYMG